MVASDINWASIFISPVAFFYGTICTRNRNKDTCVYLMSQHNDMCMQGVNFYHPCTNGRLCVPVVGGALMNDKSTATKA